MMEDKPIYADIKLKSFLRKGKEKTRNWWRICPDCKQGVTGNYVKGKFYCPNCDKIFMPDNCLVEFR